MLIKPILIYYKLFYAAGHYFGWILKVESERLYCQILSTGIYWIVRWSRRPEIITALIRNWQQKGQIPTCALQWTKNYFILEQQLVFFFTICKTNLQQQKRALNVFLYRQTNGSDWRRFGKRPDFGHSSLDLFMTWLIYKKNRLANVWDKFTF